MSDSKTILSTFRVNEREGFQCLYDSCYRSLVYFADSIVDDPEVAEDIVQEVFVDLWMHKRYYHISGDIVDYIYKSVRFASLRYLKKSRQQQKAYENFVVESEAENMSVEDLEPDRVELLFSLVNKLPEERRKIFMMASVKGMKYKEVADNLGISINTVKTQLVRSLRFLREELSKNNSITLFFIWLRKKIF